MTTDTSHASRPVHQVMVSSTFTDLKEHRAAMIAAIHNHKLHANVMEHDSTTASGDVIDASLKMVRDSAAYILVIGFKYGQTPVCPDRNAKKLSITELEFNEAQRLSRPTLLFIMGEHHDVKIRFIEKNPENEAKLNAFRERARKAAPNSAVNRVYSVFNSMEEFKEQIHAPLAEFARHLTPAVVEAEAMDISQPDRSTIPTAPAFYAVPDYIGSHQFVGRQAELDVLSDWAKPDDPTNLLLFEAIGGNGKSMLTWEWTNKQATQVRDAPESAWAGRFWYSFYERGAIMADFCQRALAYMTGQPLAELRKKKTAELREPLLAQLHAKPWLLILDGLERVLVAYHRIDAAEMPDEDANNPTDKIVNRNPCDAIRDEDNDLLRALAAATPSKILVSSRLTPRVLLNPSGQPITGAKRITLSGLLPSDAERLLRSCRIEGDSTAIQSYLTTNCDNHPLVIGILGGLIHNYLPARGNFDAWAADPDGGAKLDLASLDLIQRRNHILLAAFDVLPGKSSELLCTLALLSESVDYETLKALNPYKPKEQLSVEKPDEPEKEWDWVLLREDEKEKRKEEYRAALARWHDYEQKAMARVDATLNRHAGVELQDAVVELERSGLLQYDPNNHRYDLHPVVRSVAAGRLFEETRETHGLRVLDHFSRQLPTLYERVVELAEVAPGLNVIRTLHQIGRTQRAARFFLADTGKALLALEAYAEILSVIRPFFPNDWGGVSNDVGQKEGPTLMHYGASALLGLGLAKEALETLNATIQIDFSTKIWPELNARLVSVYSALQKCNLPCRALRVADIALNLSIARDDQEFLFLSRLILFSIHTRIGNWVQAEENWRILDPMGRDWPRRLYSPGNAECLFVSFKLCRGILHADDLALAERKVNEGNARILSRELHGLRGTWLLEQGEWALAAASFDSAVTMARERRLVDEASETGLALTKHHLGQLTGDAARNEAERLAQLRQPAHRTLAMLWLALGDPDRAQPHALAAYRRAWADGEPYVNRYELTKTTDLLQQMGVPIPTLPPYDAAKDEPFPWEADVRAAIEKLRAEKDVEEA